MAPWVRLLLCSFESCVACGDAFCMCLVFFFFQAEDGIRDLVRSRGLGDVYKRQHPADRAGRSRGAGPLSQGRGPPTDLPQASAAPNPVSYTHLTLPTSDLV